MRPLRLTIAGLHSFREKQVIDFTQLADTGMFGIFGPTGSGKSTILDAITLALYGEVGRSSRKQGILNHAEKQVAVSFEFEIGRRDARKHYRVDRSFKRAEGYSVIHHTSRLLELDDLLESQKYGEIVLADSKREVDQMIRAIIGLEPKDFTRAVVLPQGKFAEFLQLSGADRNQMAERLFGLEQYGVQLSKRISDRQNQDAGERENVIAAQNELGDASNDAVARAQTAALEAEQTLAASGVWLDQMKTAYEESKQVWALQNQYEKASQVMAQHQFMAKEMLRLRVLIEVAERANRAWPYVEGAQAIARKVEELEVAYTEGVAAENLAQGELQRARVTLQNRKSEKEQEEPLLLLQMGQLDEAFALEEGLQQRTVAFAELTAAHQAAIIRYQTATDKQALLVQEEQNLSNRIVNTQALLDAHTISPSVRGQILTVQAMANKWQQAKNTYEMILADVNGRQMRMQKDQSQITLKLMDMETFKQKKQALEQDLQALSLVNPAGQYHLPDLDTWLVELSVQVRTLGEIEGVVEQVNARIAVLSATQVNSQSQYEQARLHLASVEQEWAQRLAAQLQDGEPCPVCGATDHLKPTMTDDRHGSLGAGQESAWEVAEHWKTELSKGEVSLHQSKDEVNRRLEELAVYRARCQQLWEQNVPAAVANSDVESWGSKQWTCAIDDAGKFVADLRSAQMKWQEQMEQITQNLSGMQEPERLLEQELTALQSKLQVTNQELDRQRSALETAQSELATILVAWQKGMNEFGIQCDDVEENGVQLVQEQVNRVEEWDRLAANEREQMAALRERLFQLQAEVNEISLVSHQAEREVGDASVRRAGLEREIETNKHRLSQLIGDQSAIQVRENIRQSLDNLHHNLELATAAELNANHILSKATENRVQAEAELTLEKNHQQVAVEKLEKVLAEEKFLTIEQVKDARINENERVEVQYRIQQYDNEGIQYQAILDELAQQLSGQKINNEQWELAQANLKLADDKHQEALAIHAQTQMRWDDIQVKHARWEELNLARRQLDARVNQLKILKDILRGNSFVEFMAREQMVSVTRQASERLVSLTRGRYALEIVGEGEFMMRDLHNGGATRPVSSLSGGETFLTSLALALALSAHIQLRGKYPLEFFFLDEGFGTLDQDLLDVVVTELEKLHFEQIAIGVISHVPELRERLQRRLIVEPAEPAGRGTRLKIEHA
jgi:exonuclease SbcC